MIIETCPVCGASLQGWEITTYPSIPVRKCMDCGWYWEGKSDQIQYVPFSGERKKDYVGRKDAIEQIRIYQIY